MFETILKKVGYQKLTNREASILHYVNVANDWASDVFIDYLKTTKKQKIYIRDGRKTIMKRILGE